MTVEVTKASLYAVVKPNVSVSKVSAYVPLVEPLYVTKTSLYAVIGETNAKLSKSLDIDYKIRLSIDLDFDYRIIRPFGLSMTLDYAIIGRVNADLRLDYKIGLRVDKEFDYGIQDQPPDTGTPTPGGAHSYWRIRYQFVEVDNVQFGEVYFLDAAGTDLCSGGTVIKSTEYNNGVPYFAAINAFDRNTSTGYAALGNYGNWIGYHFASAVEVDKIRLVASAAFPANNARGLLVEYSDDGSAWVVLSDFTDPGGAMAGGADRTIDFTNKNYYGGGDTSNHRYWRMRSLINGQDSYSNIQQIDFLDGSGASLTASAGGSASASEEQGPTYTATKAFANTGLWYSNGTLAEYWLKWDFGSGNAQAPAKLYLKADSSVPNRAVHAFVVEFSDDNSTWTTRYIQGGFEDWTSAQARTYTFGAPSPPGDVYKDIQFNYKIKREIHKDIAFDFRVLHAPIFKEITFDFAIDQFGKSVTFDYKIRLNKLLTLDYKIRLHKDISFSYAVDGDFRTDVTFNYKIALRKDITFDSKIKLRHDISFDYKIGEIGSVDVPYFARLPEVPVNETWLYLTKISTSDNGKEQRVTLRRRPRVTLGHTYVAENDADFRHFQGLLFAQRNQDIYVGMHSQAVWPDEAPYGETDIYCDMEATDIRADDYVVFFNIGTEESTLRIVVSTDTDHFTIGNGGLPFPVGVGFVVMPVRLMRFGGNASLSMTYVSGGMQVTFEDATKRSIVRPGVGVALDSFDSLPVLTQRPLNDDNVDDVYGAGFFTIDMSPRMIPALVRRFPAPFVARTYKFLIERGEGLDYWREFADTVRGSLKPFLVPTWRADLVAIAFAGTSLTIEGNKLDDIIALGSYRRLMIVTNEGNQYARVETAIVDGDNTVLTLADTFDGDTIKSISFLNKVRITDDMLAFEHRETNSVLTLNLRTVLA